MSKYNLDFVGLNTFIYEPVTFGDLDEFLVVFGDFVFTLSGYEFVSIYDHMGGTNDAGYYGFALHQTLRERYQPLVDFGMVLDGGIDSLPKRGGVNLTGIQDAFQPIDTDDVYTNFNHAMPLQSYKNYKFPFELPTTASFFTALMIRRNGPYGWPAFNSTRLGQNPLTRKQRKSNLLTVLGERKRITNNNGQIITARNGQITLFNEPCVATNSPLTFRLARDLGVGAQYYRNFRNRRGRPLISRPLPIAVKVSFDNEVNMFSNTELDNILGIEQKERSERYESLSNMYLGGALDLPISAITRFRSLTFSQGLFPREKYSFKSYTRARPFFDFSWRHKQEDRDTFSFALDETKFGTLFSSSMWHLDVPDEWKNWPAKDSEPFVQRLGFNRPDNNFGGKFDRVSASYGKLWNTFSQAAVQLETSKAYYGSTFNENTIENKALRPGPIYARRHTLPESSSVVSPSGLTGILNSVKTGLTGSNYDFLFSGEAAWDTPISASAFPFYNSYNDYCEDIKRIGKDYSIIPEFKISNFVEYYQTNDVQDPISNFLEISGGHPSFKDSTTDKFFEIYSTTEFLKNFDVVLKDHKNFVEPSHLKITCNIISKFIPYDGFYPVQRTSQIADQFFRSYANNIYGITGSVNYEGGTGRSSVDDYPHAADLVMRPLFGPGVLFNAIKSGVACDYPIITSSVLVNEHAGNYQIGNAQFSNRIPFEALVEPQQYLADINLVNMEVHPSSSYRGTGSWDGRGDDLYAKMASNFLAEVPEFFLRGKNFTTIASVPSSDPNFGRAIAGKTYGMRVKMYRSMTGSASQITSSEGREYVVPQDLIDGTRKESITMYSRPSAFGPPCAGITVFRVANANGALVNFESEGFAHVRKSTTDIQLGKDSRHGYNFPFTPPYYHGQAWADIIFKPTTTKKYTVQEIIDQSQVRYYRFWTGSYAEFTNPHSEILGISGFTGANGGPQHFLSLNDNAMQLSGAVNLFGIATLGEFNENPVSDPSEPARWTIQTKFETPILNFKEYEDKTKITLCNNPASSSIPRGMWHQFGRIPRLDEGIFLQVDKIPFSWQFGAAKATPSTATASLADLCGFSTTPQKLGLMPRVTVLREAVVAIPFIDKPEGRKFFSINRGRNDPKGKFAIDIAIKRIAGINPNILESHYGEVSDELIDITRKMQDFVMPPQMDFVNFPDDVDPFVLYIFDFERKVARKGLSHIWQGVLPPRLGVEHRKQSASIQHSLLTSELLKQKDLKQQTLKWLVFKIKKRAKINYFDKVYTQANGIPKKVVRGQYAQSETFDFIGGKEAKHKISYNWPYDFFSIIELVKIKADVKFADFDIETGLEKEIVSKDLSAINDPTLSSIDD